jgi:hypothetical protein
MVSNTKLRCRCSGGKKGARMKKEQIRRYKMQAEAIIEFIALVNRGKSMIYLQSQRVVELCNELLKKKGEE